MCMCVMCVLRVRLIYLAELLTFRAQNELCEHDQVAIIRVAASCFIVYV